MRRSVHRNATLRSSFALVAALSATFTPRNARAQDFVVAEATINKLLNAMETGQVTAVQLVDAFLARIEAYDRRGPQLNAMIRLNPNARAEAEQLDRERAFNGPRGPLHGIPIILKDNYDTFDMPTAAASIALAGLVPPDDGFQVKKLREAGAIIIGKANMHELAMGITTISSLGGQTLNPYDLTRYPGGSSGGTGAAIAASFAAVGWGSDTCGSIRIPSSQNNLFGLRPTKGLSSIDGIIPLSHVAVMGERALGALEIRPKNGFYNYTAKYTEGKADHVMPAPIAADAYDEALRLAFLAHQTLGCRGVSRADLRYDDTAGEPGRLYVLEVNTQPGMTPLSLVPEIAAHAGIEFGELVGWMVEEAQCDS